MPKSPRSRTKRISRAFTLLEVMLVLVLLTIVAGAIGMRIGKAVEEKKFQSAADRLLFELGAAHRLSLNMQADWILLLEQRKGSFHLVRACPEKGKQSVADWEAPCSFFWNGKEAKKIVFQFASSGKVSPSGKLELVHQKSRIAWELPGLFCLQEGDDGALKKPLSF